MYRLLLTILFFLLFITSGFAQQRPQKVYGTVRIDDTTFMSDREVMIAEWMDFIVNNNFEESLFPDSSCLTAPVKLVFNDLRRRKKFKYLKVSENTGHEKLNGQLGVGPSSGFKELVESDTDYFALNLPVTGVSFHQVQLFCRWKEAILFGNGYQQISVSIPSADLYKRLIPNIDSLSKNCKCFVLNCSTAKNNRYSKDKRELTQGHGLEPVESYFPTSLGLYNIEGNAAEMTSTYGIAMGGSFRQSARESFNDKYQKYNKPEDWLGFRYVITAK